MRETRRPAGQPPDATSAPAGSDDPQLTVLVPSFNEEQRLPGTLAGLARFLDDWGVDYQVVVVDDGSRDGTAEVSRRFGQRFSTLRLTQQAGKGAAVRRGMLAATGRVVAFTDADLPYDLGALRTACGWIESGECEAVFGARDLAEATCHAPRRLSRTVASAAFRQIVRLTISREVTDTQCGLKVFSRHAARQIFSRTTVDGFAFDAEVVLLCQRLRLPFRRIAVKLVNEYSSTLSLSRHAWGMLRDVLLLALRDRFSKPAVLADMPLAPTPTPNDQSRRAA